MVILLDFAFFWNESWVAKEHVAWVVGLLVSTVVLYAGSIALVRRSGGRRENARAVTRGVTLGEWGKGGLHAGGYKGDARLIQVMQGVRGWHTRTSNSWTRHRFFSSRFLSATSEGIKAIPSGFIFIFINASHSAIAPCKNIASTPFPEPPPWSNASAP